MFIGFLGAVPSEAWVALFGVILGAGLSIFGVSLTNKSNIKSLSIQLENQKSTERSRLHRERLEELYVLVGNWSTGFMTMGLSILQVMAGRISYNDHLDLLIEDNKSKSFEFSRIRMIVDIYGSDFNEHFDELIKMRETSNDVITDFKIAHNNGRNGKIFIDPFIISQNNFETASENLRREIASLARQI
jgi:hypothetical protein